MRTETHDRAMDRLRDQIAASKNPMEQDAGELITLAVEHLSEQDARKLTDEKKTLTGALAALRQYALEEAKKRGKNAGGVGIGDSAALKPLLKYYGIEAPGIRLETRVVAGDAPQAPAAAEPASDDLSLDALLEV